MEELSQQGKIKDANPLGRYEGRIVSRKKGQAGTDGPFVESKEGIGGYLLLQVNDLEEAVAIAKQCPALEYGLEWRSGQWSKSARPSNAPTKNSPPP